MSREINLLDKPISVWMGAHKKIFKPRPYSMDVDRLLSLPANVYHRNCQGYYLNVNDRVAAFVGMSRQECIETNDIDLCQKRDWTNETVLEFKQAADQVLASCTAEIKLEKELVIENQKLLYLSYRFPLFDQKNEVAGTLGISFDLYELKIPSLNELTQAVLSFQPKISIKKDKSLLTQREKECINELMQGKTIKEVAATLQLSSRTVESYLNHVKAKLGCFNRSQLLKKVIHEGLLYT